MESYKFRKCKMSCDHIFFIQLIMLKYSACIHTLLKKITDRFKTKKHIILAFDLILEACSSKCLSCKSGIWPSYLQRLFWFCFHVQPDCLFISSTLRLQQHSNCSMWPTHDNSHHISMLVIPVIVLERLNPLSGSPQSFFFFTDKWSHMCTLKIDGVVACKLWLDKCRSQSFKSNHWPWCLKINQGQMLWCFKINRGALHMPFH